MCVSEVDSYSRLIERKNDPDRGGVLRAGECSKLKSCHPKQTCQSKLKKNQISESHTFSFSVSSNCAIASKVLLHFFAEKQNSLKLARKKSTQSLSRFRFKLHFEALWFWDQFSNFEHQMQNTILSYNCTTLVNFQLSQNNRFWNNKFHRFHNVHTLCVTQCVLHIFKLSIHRQTPLQTLSIICPSKLAKEPPPSMIVHHTNNLEQFQIAEQISLKPSKKLKFESQTFIQIDQTFTLVNHHSSSLVITSTHTNLATKRHKTGEIKLLNIRLQNDSSRIWGFLISILIKTHA